MRVNISHQVSIISGCLFLLCASVSLAADIGSVAEKAKESGSTGGPSQNSGAKQKLELLPLPKAKYTLANTEYAKRSDWLGLYVNGKTSELKNVTLLASPTKVQAYDGDKLPAQSLKIQDGSLPLCLIRGLANQTPRRVPTFYRPPKDRRTVMTSQSFEIKADGNLPYRIVLRKSKNSMTYSIQQGDKKQVLQTVQTDEIVGDSGLTKKDEIVVWCGDLDEDGKADFLTRFTERSGEALTMQLYLSGGAGKGKIVKPAARFDYWDPANPGC